MLNKFTTPNVNFATIDQFLVQYIEGQHCVCDGAWSLSVAIVGQEFSQYAQTK